MERYEGMVIGIIGGGASGMAAALAAGEKEENQVILLERQARVGRKLQATGNGRCNLSNLQEGQSHYHGQEPSFSRYALERFGPGKTRKWFASLGLYTVAEPGGRVYPYSDQANSVVDILRFALERPNITVKLGFEVERVKKTPEGFRVISGQEEIVCQRLIVACGGLAGSKLGGTMSGYKLLRSLGHSCTRLRPNLVQMKSSWGSLPALKGIRANCRAEILHDGMIFASSQGELQFTEYGLSGPVMFEISRDVCQGGGQWECRLDFLPDMGEETLTEMLKKKQGLPAEELFTGILHNRLGRVLVQTAGISGKIPISALSDWDFQQAANLAKSLRVPLTEPLGMDSAQVTSGGIRTGEFREETMESRLIPGLYACGEVLDIDGDCGGYNLQWAWSSGRLAGESAGREGV